MNVFNKILRSILFFCCVMWCNASLAALFDKPVATDSRIRTFVYSPNEIFRVVVHYGYQTNIEFAEGEEVQTISVGNNYAWQLSPLNRRLFIKPLEENILTNMTLITNKRTYQFELQSKDLMGFTDDELVYVVRFFYPDSDSEITAQDTSLLTASLQDEPIPEIQPYNFNYKVSGPVLLAPTKVFDDGIITYFKFPEKLKEIPQIESVSDEGIVVLTPKKMGEYIIVNKLSAQFHASLKNQKVEVVNNTLMNHKNAKYR